MRISDWSSDVCSSDLIHRRTRPASLACRADPSVRTPLRLAAASRRGETSLTDFPLCRTAETASRTVGPHHFLRRIERGASPSALAAAEENRDPHRRSRGRFAILDPASAARRAAPVIQDRQEPIMQIISTSAAADNAAFFAAIANAERRALHSYFDQHVVADEEAG